MTARTMTTTTTTAVLALALGLALAPAASAGSSGAADRQPAFLTSAVVSGSIAGAPGNRHQVVIDKSHNTEVTGWIRSWTCPEDASVSLGWASARCTHRLTQSLRPRWGTSATVRLSSTTRSARVAAPDLVGVNRATGYARKVPVSLTIVAADGAELTGEAGARFWNPSRAWGSVGGASYWDSNAWVGESQTYS